MKTYLHLSNMLILMLLLSSCQSPKERAEDLIREGITKSYQVDYDGAIKCFEQASKLQPELAEPYFYLAGIQITQRKFSLALENLNKAIQLKEDYGMAYANRGKVLFILTGDRIQACPDWLKAHELGVPSLSDEIKHCPGVLN